MSMLFPMTDDGSAVLMDSAPPVYWHNGLPFTAEGYIATGDGPVAYYSQGLPFNSLGQLVTQAPPTP